MESSTKLIFADYRLPKEAFDKLSNIAPVVSFDAGDITHPAIKGHPDLFLCQCGKHMVVAPNIPSNYLDHLRNAEVDFELGESPAEKEHPAAARYNAVCCESTLIHKLDVTEHKVKEKFKERDCIAIPQAYSRCSILAVDQNSYITSDRGVEKALRKAGKEVLFVDPYPIVLPGLPWGFFGGCCGMKDDTIYFSGSLRFFKEEKDIRDFCSKRGKTIVELFDGSPFDGGGIVFV